MKKIKFLIYILAFITINVNAQSKAKNKTSETPVFDNTNEEVKMQVNNLLMDYYKIKDALVADNNVEALAAAKEFKKAIEKVDMNKMTTAEHSYYMSLQPKLVSDAEKLNNASDIKNSRAHFQTLSDNMFSIVKAFKANNGNAAYFDYCPMAKAGWISNSTGIKNPYYGKKMMECGSIKDSIK